MNTIQCGESKSCVRIKNSMFPLWYQSKPNHPCIWFKWISIINKLSSRCSRACHILVYMAPRTFFTSFFSPSPPTLLPFLPHYFLQKTNKKPPNTLNVPLKKHHRWESFFAPFLPASPTPSQEKGRGWPTNDWIKTLSLGWIGIANKLSADTKSHKTHTPARQEFCNFHSRLCNKSKFRVYKLTKPQINPSQPSNP